jgi:succinate dehydrogenase / fumarate reductase flavoprotein subunit
MKIYPAVHYTMGGLWVDYNLMTTIDGLFALGEANFSDHGANRLGASALMQGLADGYFIIPYTIGGYLAGTKLPDVDASAPEFAESRSQIQSQVDKLLSLSGKRTVADFHRTLGKILWDYCGIAKEEESLKKAKQMIAELRAEFWENVTVPGDAADLNQALENAGRVSDFMEFGEDHEALRDDDNYCHVSVWQYTGADSDPVLHTEPLEFENVELTQRSYK